MSDQTLSIQYLTPRDAPMWFTKQQEELSKKEFLQSLSNYLWEHRDTRMCVSIKKSVDIYHAYPSDTTTITCRIDAVREYPVHMVMPKFETMSWKALSGSAIAEIRHRVANWLRGIK